MEIFQEFIQEEGGGLFVRKVVESAAIFTVYPACLHVDIGSNFTKLSRF